MCYRRAHPGQETERARQRIGLLSRNILVIISGKDQPVPNCDRGLPEAFISTDDKLMVLRANGLAVVDTTKFTKESQEHNRQYARLLMFCHWKDEDAFLGEARQSAEACARMYNNHKDDMDSIENGCMHLLRTLII